MFLVASVRHHRKTQRLRVLNFLTTTLKVGISSGQRWLPYTTEPCLLRVRPRDTVIPNENAVVQRAGGIEGSYRAVAS